MPIIWIKPTCLPKKYILKGWHTWKLDYTPTSSRKVNHLKLNKLPEGKNWKNRNTIHHYISTLLSCFWSSFFFASCSGSSKVELTLQKTGCFGLVSWQDVLTRKINESPISLEELLPINFLRLKTFVWDWYEPTQKKFEAFFTLQFMFFVA